MFQTLLSFSKIYFVGNASQHVVHPKIAVILGKGKKTKVQCCFAPPSSSFVLFHSLILLFVGKVARQHVVPKFKDILEYLEYLNLDEPIIGKYFCSDIWQSSLQSLWLSHLLNYFFYFCLRFKFFRRDAIFWATTWPQVQLQVM